MLHTQLRRLASPLGRRRSRPEYAGLVRFLKRLTIWLRWPAAIAATALVGACIASVTFRYGCQGHLELRGEGHWLEYAIYSMRYDIRGCVNDERFIDPRGDPAPWVEFRERFDEYLWSVRPLSQLFEWSRFDFGEVPEGSPGQYYFESEGPLWPVVLPPALLAVAGFVLKRRGPKPGQCQHCRHHLAGAAMCPECGTPAPAAAA